MSELLNRFSFQASKFNAQIAACFLFLWLVVLWCVIASILAQPFSPRQRLFWIAIVVFLPLFGVLAYLPFSFKREDLPQFFVMKTQKDRQKRAAKKGANTPPSGGRPA
jgi:hypothetical protein